MTECGAALSCVSHCARLRRPTTLHAIHIGIPKEPQPEEVGRLSAQHTLFTYLHLAADPRLALAPADSGARAIAYETVEDAAGRLPLLRPMSEIAGRLSAQAGAAALTGPAGGRGLLMGGVPGVWSRLRCSCSAGASRVRPRPWWPRGWARA